MLFICNKCIFLCVDDANKICIVLYCIVYIIEDRGGMSTVKTLVAGEGSRWRVRNIDPALCGL